jgi:hypothetical protein
MAITATTIRRIDHQLLELDEQRVRRTVADVLPDVGPRVHPTGLVPDLLDLDGAPTTVSRRRNVASGIITMSGCECSQVRSPGASRYSSTRTRSFSNTTEYSPGSVTTGSVLTEPAPTGLNPAPTLMITPSWDICTTKDSTVP